MSCCKFSLFLDKGDTIQSYVSRIESQVNQHFAKKKKKKKQAFIVLNSEKDVSFVFPKNPNFITISVNSNKNVSPLRGRISGCVL